MSCPVAHHARRARRSDAVLGCGDGSGDGGAIRVSYNNKGNADRRNVRREPSYFMYESLRTELRDFGDDDSDGGDGGVAVQRTHVNISACLLVLCRSKLSGQRNSNVVNLYTGG